MHSTSKTPNIKDQQELMEWQMQKSYRLLEVYIFGSVTNATDQSIK